MPNKESLIDCMEEEINITKSLYTKLPGNMLDFSPGENMRTTLELLRYLTICSSSMISYFLIQENGSEAIKSNFTKYVDRAESMKAEEFPQRMDEQLSEIKELLAPLSDEDLVNKIVTLPSNAKKPFGDAIMETCVKWLSAYKMQLFLYAKMNGASELNTMDCWIAEEPGNEKEETEKEGEKQNTA